MTGFEDDDATALAARVRTGEVHPTELVDAAIAAVERVNPALNAVVHPLYERARAEAKGALPDGPFRGVPFAIKDLDGALGGEPYTQSSRSLRAHVAPHDSEVIARMRRTGVIPVCKTNTPEFGIMGVTESELRGPARNPWDPSVTPGGSSGGSAALVAARALPFAHAGDGGGSIRIPASHTGLFGLKPTRARVPVDGGEAWSGYVQQLVVSRSVRDTAAMLDAIHGPSPGAPYQVLPPARRYVDEIETPPGRLKIAFTAVSLLGRTTDPAHAAAVHDTAKLLADLGHEVVEEHPPIEREALVRAYLVVVAAGVAAAIAESGRLTRRAPVAADFELSTWLLGQIGTALSAYDLHKAREDACAAGRAMATFHERYDLLLTATTAYPPPVIGELGLKSYERFGLRLMQAAPVKAVLLKVLDDLAGKSLEKTPNTQLFNQTGQPAMSVPLATGPGGLPIGLQLSAAFGDEGTLLRLAAQLEQARPWAGRKPGIHA